MGTEHRLGARAFAFFLFQNAGAGSILLILCGLLAPFRDPVIALLLALRLFRAPDSSVENFFLMFSYGLLVLSLVLICLGAFLSLVDYFSASFAFDEFDLRLEFGILRKKEMAIPYRQVQNVNISQSVLMRIFCVGKLEILTAGNDRHEAGNESEGMFGIIDIRLAEMLKEELLKRSGVQAVREVK